MSSCHVVSTFMNHRMKALLLATTTAMLTAACGGSTDPGLNAHVRFEIDAPLCSNPYPVNFFIDDVQVGRDTMWFGVPGDMPPNGMGGFLNFKSDESFSVEPGSHVVRAAIIDTVPSFAPFTYVWPDTTVDLAAGAEVVRKLPFYCS